MTKDQINDIKIGLLEPTDTTDDDVAGYWVIGLPDELKTQIRSLGNPPSEWSFYVLSELHQSLQFGSKEEALEDLKDWLRDRFDSRGWLERGDQIVSTE